MSFIKMKNKGRNGSKVGVDGKKRNRITKEEFARCAFECNGDVKKMAEESNLNQPAIAIKNRYENLVKKDYQYENKDLPPMIYESTGRTRVTIDRTKFIKLAETWNKSGGDADVVAEEVGCSVATVLMKIRELDKIYEERYKKELIESITTDPENEGISEEDAVALAEDKIANEGYVSYLCERKTKRRGAKADNLSEADIDSITNLLDAIEVPEEENVEIDIEAMIAEHVENMEVE